MECTKPWVEAFLNDRLDKLNAPGGVEVTDLVRFPRGSSRDTWFIHFRDRGTQAPHAVVLRADWGSGSLTPGPLYHEYLIYERLGRTDVPVAEVLWWEEDPKWIPPGQPFYLRKQVDGSSDVPHFHDPDPRYDALRIEISKDHLRKLTLVHQVDWRALGLDEILPPPKDEADCAHHYVDWIVAAIEDLRQGDLWEGLPIVLEAAEWLHDHAPVAPRVCLCKGTNGLGEEVLRGTEVVALSDWEEASIGDPAADFAFMQHFIPDIERDGKKIWGIEQAVAFYREHSGIDVTVESVNYYFVLRSLRAMLFGVNPALAVSRGAASTARWAWTGIEPMSLFKRILAATAGIMPPLPPDRLHEFMKTL